MNLDSTGFLAQLSSVDIWQATLRWSFAAVMVACFFTALGWRACQDFSRAELEELCRRRKKPELLGTILKQDDWVATALEGLFLVLLALSVYLAVAIVEGLWTNLTWFSRVTYLAGLTLTVLTGAHWLPWAIARVWAAPVTYYLWPLWQRLATLGKPLAWGNRFFEVVLKRLGGHVDNALPEEALEEELRTVVSEGHREGILEADAQHMIVSVIELSDATVSKIMTPRTYVVSIPKTAGWREMLQTVIQSGHTRLPVYDKNRDDIVGVLYVKDLLPVLAECAGEPDRHWSELVRQPMFVPETKRVDDLLQQFQQTRNHLAVVLDEYGGLAGVVTLEDILEEIVGEIADESDREEVHEIRRLDDRRAEVLGRSRLDEINEAFGLELPENGEVETIGGLLFSELGRVPQVGDELQLGNVKLRVLEATHRRVEKVLIELLEGTFPPAPEE
ncbi:MAG: hemolysin family protein [Thermoguttaceae bacterium]|nr:hemolysin family protein [Thermoguttaceae bacterium]MDW8079331.1 hemolysin family protein [Thermoguttaceae bacterium]